MPHHERAEVGLGTKLAFGPDKLSRGGLLDDGRVCRGECRVVAESPRDGESGRSRKRSEECNDRSSVKQVIQERGNSSFLMQAVAMNGEDRAGTDVKPKLPSVKADTRFGPPERVTPAVVVTTDHEHRHSTRELDDPRGDLDAVSGDQAFVGEPEVVDIARQEQRVAKLRRGVEKGEESFLVSAICAEVCVGNHDKLIGSHGAKGGP